MRSEGLNQILTWRLIVNRREDSVEKLVLIEIAFETAKPVRGTIKQDWQIVRVLKLSLMLVDFEP